MFVGVELSGVENVVIGSVGEVFLKLFFSRFDEHVGHEKGVVGPCADDSDTDSFFQVEASVTVDDVESLSGVEIVSGEVFEDGEGRGSHWDVDFAPCDLLLTDGIFDDSLGSWRSAE